MKIAFEISVEEAELLSSTAVRLGVRPEELARATIADVLSQDKEALRKAAEYVVQKNRELYQRLSWCATNLSIVRRTALSLLKNELTRKVGIKNKRLAAALDETYLEKVLVGT
jgi:hypothetical protein